MKLGRLGVLWAIPGSALGMPGGCLMDAWVLSGRCLGDAWEVPWGVPGRCPGDVPGACTGVFLTNLVSAPVGARRELLGTTGPLGAAWEIPSPDDHSEPYQ